jgi:hypothetical protein
MTGSLYLQQLHIVKWDFVLIGGNPVATAFQKKGCVSMRDIGSKSV